MLLYISITIFIFTSLMGYYILSIFINNSTYEERIINSITLGKKTDISHFIPPRQLYQLTIATSSLMFLFGMLLAPGSLTNSLLLGIIFSIPGAIIPSLFISYLITKRTEKINAELPGVLELLSSSLYAGLTLQQAISRNIDKMPKTIASEFKIIVNECRLGVSLVDSINHWSERTTLMDIKLMAIATELALKHGGNLSSTYKKLANTIRERYLFQQEVETLTTEGKMQAIIMTLLPFFILIIMLFLRKQAMIEFISSPLGMGAITLVVVMQVTAYFWIKKLVTVEI